MSGNTSATGGPLLPIAGGPAPLEGVDLLDFIQAWIVGITGIDGTLVRPSWQRNVESLPVKPGATCYCAFHIGSRASPESPNISHDGAANGGLGQDNFARNQELTILLTWYDTGITGQADYYDSLFADGVTIGQNREYLKGGGFDYGWSGEAAPVPVIVKERWQYRLDRRVILRRIINRAYPVLNVAAAEVALHTSDGLTETITSPP